MMQETLLKKWKGIAGRYAELTEQLMDPTAASQPMLLHKINKERTEIEQLAEGHTAYCALRQQLLDVEANARRTRSLALR